MSKLAVITGADGGIGKEITRAVAEAGGIMSLCCVILFLKEKNVRIR